MQNTIQAERTAAMRIIKRGLDAGYTVSVNDGEEWTVKRSSSAHQVRVALQSTDADLVKFRDVDGNAVGSIYFVWGNSPDEVASDYTDNAAVNALVNG